MTLSRMYFKSGDYTRSRNAIRMAIDAMTANKVDNWLIALAHVQLGECYLKLNQLEPAEESLRLGCSKLVEHRVQIPYSHQDRMQDAIRSLADFYQTKGDQVQASQWLAKISP